MNRIVCLCLLLATGHAATVIYGVFAMPSSLTVPLLLEIRGNISLGVYVSSFTRLNSIVNQTSNLQIPLEADLVGNVEILLPVRIVNTVSSLLTISFVKPLSAAVFKELANYHVEMSEAVGLKSANLIQSAGFTSAQDLNPGLEGDDSVPLALILVISGTIFLGTAALSACGLRRKLIRKARGVNFNELVSLEREMQEEYDMQLQNDAKNLL